MKTYLFILLWFLVPKKLIGAENYNLNLDKYLERKSEILYDEVMNKMRNIRQTGAHVEEPQILGTYIRSTQSTDGDPSVNVFTLFNKTFFTIDNEIFVGTLNGTLEMKHYSDFEHSNTIFFKAHEYQQTGFLALSTERVIMMYTFNDNQTTPTLIQTILNQYSSDGIFFNNGNNMYFICGSNRGEHIGFIRTFKWMGSHFDEIEIVHTTGAVIIKSFSYQQQEIIIIGQKLAENVTVHSPVYTFKQDKLRKMQQLDINRPNRMDIYFQGDVPYILIYEENKSQKLYKWNGFEMVLVNRFHWKHKVDKSIVVYSNTSPLIVQPQLNQVFAMRPHDDDIKLYKTKGYISNYSVILDINKGENENGNITFIVGLNEENIINIYGMSFKAHAEMEREQEGALRKCFNNLEMLVYGRQDKINQMDKSLNHGRNVTIIKRQANFKDINVENKLDDIQNQLNTFKTLLTAQGNSTNTLIVNSNVTVKGDIKAKTVNANKIALKIVNGKPWTPEKWLLYTQDQIIRGPVKINEIRTNVLISNATLFKNLLRNNGNQKLTGKFKIKKLSATKMYSKKVNNIEVNEIYRQGDTMTINGIKSFQNVSATRANVTKINGKIAEDVLANLQSKTITSNLKFASNVRIDNLEVNSIDGINWNKFENAVFKIGDNIIIRGNLTMPKLIVNKLKAKILNGINVAHLMTTSTDQIINSSIEFNHIRAKKIQCEYVNDINITNAVIVNGNGTVIKSHVIFKEIHVRKDLELVGKPGRAFFLKKGQHIFGTNTSDLIQHYTDKVRIKGNLYINDFSCLHNTTLFIKGNEYTIDMLKEYWNKHGNQVIPVHFEAKNGVSTPRLITKSLNEIPIEQFALNNGKTSIRSPLFFENVTVKGNVILKREGRNNAFNLTKLAAEGVKNDGGKYKLNGKKTFKNILTIRDLKTDEKTRTHLKNLLKNGPTSGKRLTKVIVKGDLIADNINTETINLNNITKYLNALLSLNKPQNLTELTMKNVIIEDLQVRTINQQNVTDYLAKLQNIIEKKEIPNVNVKGNVTLQHVNNLKTINGHQIDKFLNKPVNETEWSGNVKFTKKVRIGNLTANTINNIDLQNLTRRLLHKTSNQTITGIYTFNNLKTVNLFADKINNKNIKNLIDVSSKEPQEIIAPNGVKMKKIKFEKSLLADKMLPCDIYNAMKHIRYPETQTWAEVEILGNVTFLDDNCDIVRILKRSVKKDQENIISAPVNIKGHVVAEQIQAKSLVNGINLTDLIEDAVLNESDEEQVITGPKMFQNSIYADDVTVLSNADIPVINKIIVERLYKNIIPKHQVNNITILGRKTFFGGLQTERFLAKKISGINPKNIVSLANSKPIPQVIFDKIDVVHNLNVKTINSFDLNYILNNRLFTNTTERQITNAVYFFNDLEIIDNLRTASINDIQMANVIFDIDNQKIIGPKRFLQNVTIFGNLQVGHLNGINITDAYNNAVLLSNNETINGSMTILNPVRLDGNITANTINGYPIDQIKGILNHPIQSEEQEIIEITGKVKNIIKDSLTAVTDMPNEFMYIEKAENLQIKISNAIDARLTKIKDFALIHIESEESHDKCQLPEGCKCPMQYTVEVSPSGSVVILPNKEQQRVYTYYDGSMVIHLIVYSISMNSYCRTNQSSGINERSILIWSISNSDNFTNYEIPPMYFFGYITGAEFFTIDTVTYGIIARHYHSGDNTYELDCTVIRISADKQRASVIQKISTQAVRTLYLMHTAQGVVAVIGNMGEQPYTQIFRFNQEIEQFDLLKTVSYGCTKAVGMVRGTDSLIILANNDAPLQVLKYHPALNSYYYYQMFALEEPVLGLSVFYIGGFGISDAYLCVVTEENYRIYSFQYIDGWKLESRGVIRGLRNLIPLELNNELYLFAPTTGESLLFKVVRHGAGGT